MTDFLVNHFRYDTMHSWNCATSWANNLKIYQVIPSDLQDKVYQMIETDNFYHEINYLISEYGLSNDYRFQAGFNGRSCGYLVMYSGYEEVKQFNGRTVTQLHTYPGRSVDSYYESDYEDMSLDEIRSIVSRVQEFDTLCDDIIALVIDLARETEIETVTYQVEKSYTRLVL